MYIVKDHRELFAVRVPNRTTESTRHVFPMFVLVHDDVRYDPKITPVGEVESMPPENPQHSSDYAGFLGEAVNGAWFGFAVVGSNCAGSVRGTVSARLTARLLLSHSSQSAPVVGCVRAVSITSRSPSLKSGSMAWLRTRTILKSLGFASASEATRISESLAADQNAVIARWLESTASIEWVQQRAADGLVGARPLLRL